MVNPQKEAQVKLMKGLLDLIILQFLSTQPMHGYQIITQIRKNFGIYFGPSTIYPLLNTLEKKNYASSEWNMKGERPRKVYNLTNNGKNVLSFTEQSLHLICKKITMPTNAEMTITANNQSAMNSIVKKSIYTQTNHLAVHIP